jgi:hypothetical protein
MGALIYIAMPRELFGSHLADQRLPIGLAFLLVACVQVDLSTPRLHAAFVAALVVLTAFRVIEVQATWDRLEPATDAFQRSVTSIERGARVLITYGEHAPVRTNEDLGLMHAASLATIERSALVTTGFCVPGKHILQVREPFRNLVDDRDSRPPSAAWLRTADASIDGNGRHFWSQWSKRFDYVYVIFATRHEPDPDVTRLKRVADGPGFRLYRVIEKVGP